MNSHQVLDSGSLYEVGSETKAGLWEMEKQRTPSLSTQMVREALADEAASDKP